MRVSRSRKSAEPINNTWNLFLIKVIFPSILCLTIFCQGELTGVGMACLSNPCAYGICIDDVNSTFLCYCIDGYTGFLCQTNWDECWSNPCQNGGICIDGIAQYNCTCPQGYQGELCEQNIDECDSNPCHNNGTCIDGSNGYTCVCPSGFLGELCETDISVCNDTNEIRCLNGGLCVEGPGFTYNCACLLGWFGPFCEEAVDECVSSPCQNGAVCLDLQANYTCACPFGFTGRNCEVELEMCGETSPCQNGALCLVEDWLRVCYCVPDYHGDRCQYRYNECLLGPGCDNGGTCVDGVDGYTCSCPPGWSGNFCECLVVNENEMNCHSSTINTLIKPQPTDVKMVPIYTDIEVPKTISPKTFPTPTPSFFTDEDGVEFYFSYATECFPIWQKFTRTKPKSSTQPIMSTSNTIPPFNWLFSTKISGTTISTTKEYETNKPIVTLPVVTTPITTFFEIITQTTPKTFAMSTEAKETSPNSVTSPKTMKTTFITTKAPTPTPTTETTTAFTEESLSTIIMSTEDTLSTTLTSTVETTPTTTVETEAVTETTLATISTIENTTQMKTTLTPPITITKMQKNQTTTEIITADDTTSMSTTTTISTTISTTEKKLTIGSSNFYKPTTDVPLAISWNCTTVFCQNGGTCLHESGKPKCSCKSNWDGSFCEKKIDIKVVGFSGQSYLIHKVNSSQSIRIDLTGRTVAPRGILLYSHLGLNTFMTLYLENGLLKFKFSCGVQTMILSEVQFFINNGFDLTVTVTLDFQPRSETPAHCSAVVRINNTLAMSGEQLAKGPLNNVFWVYLGGVPTKFFSHEVPISEGFVGCMQNLAIGKNPKKIFKDSLDSEGISECTALACLSNPCSSGSTCIELNNTWICLCPSGFLGRLCEISVCKNNPCLFGGTCAPFPGSGFICLCPLGKQGLFCEKDVETGYPLFASSIAGLSSFAAFKIPIEIYEDFHLSFKFLPHDMEQISLMLFIGQDGYHSSTSDHLSVGFIKGYVVLTWNLGSGPRRIFTPHPVANFGHNFHTVQIGRVGQKAWLAVDNQRNVSGRSPGKLTQLNTRAVIFLGGHESRNFSVLPHDLPLHTGFSGCLSDVTLKVNQTLIRIDKSPVYSRGIGRCGMTLCNENSCGNGGCIHHGATFTCLCADGWFGPTCSMKYNPCNSNTHNCSHGSTCAPLINGFSCDCPVGKTGKYCEKSEELSDVKLSGIRSYITVAIDGLHQHQSCVDLEIRPLSNNGLILYSGRLESNTFWSISLQEGAVELRVCTGLQRLKGDILIVRSKRILALGYWHRIRAGRYGRRLFLWVEGTISTGLLFPGENLPISGALVYIGGAPDLSLLPNGVSGKTLQPFHGCVRKFGSQWKGIPLTKSNILDGKNVEDCDGTVCGGDVCHNGGTCHIDLNNKPYCSCSKQFIGKRCEYRLSCKEITCRNGGRCLDEKGTIPQCHCPNGWGGSFCELGLSVKSPRFKGNSYLLIDRSNSLNLKKRDVGNKIDLNKIYLNVTTIQPNGMLLWSSRDSNSEFIGIGLENEKLKIVWARVGSNATIVAPSEAIADGAWHDILLDFEFPNLTLKIDNKNFTYSDFGYPGYPISTDGKFFLGGFPGSSVIKNETLGYFQYGFDGCLQTLAWGSESAIYNFSEFEGENIRACDPFGQ